MRTFFTPFLAAALLAGTFGSAALGQTTRFIEFAAETASGVESGFVRFELVLSPPPTLLWPDETFQVRLTASDVTAVREADYELNEPGILIA